MITKLVAAAIVSHMDVTLTWEPPAIYDPPMYEWADRCVKPEGTVLISIDDPVQYALSVTNTQGFSDTKIIDAANVPATFRVPTYDEETTHTFVVVALYDTEPFESGESCEVQYVTPAMRPPPSGLRIIGAKGPIWSASSKLQLKLFWAEPLDDGLVFKPIESYGIAPDRGISPSNAHTQVRLW